jgi:hypothetical protein
MNEVKKISAPVILLILAGAFIFVSILVYLHQGKSAKWVARKMKLGAAIIAITSISTGCPSPPVIMCYDPAPTNWFNFDSIDQNDYSVVADLPNNSVLTGKVYQPDFDRYTFKILANDSQLIDQGNIVAVDGSFDATEENFKMTLNSAIDTGSYHLVIFTSDINRGSDEFEVYQTKLKIK